MKCLLSAGVIAAALASTPASAFSGDLTINTVTNDRAVPTNPAHHSSFARFAVTLDMP